MLLIWWGRFGDFVGDRPQGYGQFPGWSEVQNLVTRRRKARQEDRIAKDPHTRVDGPGPAGSSGLLMRRRQLEALQAAAGAWKNEDHPELAQGSGQWVRGASAGRRKNGRR
jgi:hypothetical protein